jgi:hypothetical protein
MMRRWPLEKVARGRLRNCCRHDNRQWLITVLGTNALDSVVLRIEKTRVFAAETAIPTCAGRAAHSQIDD